MGTVELKKPPTAGMQAYAAWHGMAVKDVQDEWADVPQDDRTRIKWEAVGAQVEAGELAARDMEIERLREALRKCETCSLATEVRDVVSAALRA